MTTGEQCEKLGATRTMMKGRCIIDTYQLWGSPATPEAVSTARACSRYSPTAMEGRVKLHSPDVESQCTPWVPQGCFSNFTCSSAPTTATALHREQAESGKRRLSPQGLACEEGRRKPHQQKLSESSRRTTAW